MENKRVLDEHSAFPWLQRVNELFELFACDHVNL